ncbi:hypothetical protein [Thauera humireducens]|uniref:hypothetical protein n=1 Tax=Thauera humireducens TaxID=1134435 RepID=UPI0031200C95
MPEDFARETAAPLPLYADTVAHNQLKVEGDDWATALAIGRHLLPNGRRSGGPIQADLTDTYTRITQRARRLLRRLRRQLHRLCYRGRAVLATVGVFLRRLRRGTVTSSTRSGTASARAGS